MSSFLLLLLPALCAASAWIPSEDWGSGNVTASEGASGQCVCHVFLPDVTFPADRVEHMQQVSKDLIQEVGIQMNKLVNYEDRLKVYLRELSELSVRVAVLQSSADNYIKLDFELLRIELREFEALVSQLKDSLNSSSPMFDDLHTEGNCNNTGTISISKPLFFQLNPSLSPGHLYGGWGKDSKPVRGFESMYFYSSYTSQSVNNFYLYSDYESLVLRSASKHHSLPHSWAGLGNNYIVHSNAIYYQNSSPFGVAKLNLTTSSYNHRVILAASTKFSYSYSDHQNLDLAADENGLWVMYASEESLGKMVLAKINEKSFGIEQEWSTGVYKQMAGNAFMACGVMYATRSVDVETEEIFYSFDTRTGEERELSVQFHKFLDKYSNLDYNPVDRKLYMYNNGYFVSYNVKFDKE